MARPPSTEHKAPIASNHGQPRRLPTALVLAIGSAMVCIGVVAFATTRPQAPDDTPSAIGGPIIDTSTPERAAESFLDAWRKRHFEDALRASTGTARAEVRRRLQTDAKLTAAERRLQGVWDGLAASRLSLQIDESETLSPERIVLRGTASGTFMEGPYRREMEFLLARSGDRWLVEEMTLGTILTPMPDAGLEAAP